MWHPELELLLLHPVATRILWRHGLVDCCLLFFCWEVDGSWVQKNMPLSKASADFWLSSILIVAVKLFLLRCQELCALLVQL